jgi:hypothetical protein
MSCAKRIEEGLRRGARGKGIWVGTTTSAAAFVKMLEVLGVTVEGIDGGKLRRDLGRCPFGPLSDRGVGTPHFGEDDFEAPPDEGGRHPFEAAPDEGRNTVVVLLPGGARCCRATAGVPRSR